MDVYLPTVMVSFGAHALRQLGLRWLRSFGASVLSARRLSTWSMCGRSLRLSVLGAYVLLQSTVFLLAAPQASLCAWWPSSSSCTCPTCALSACRGLACAGSTPAGMPWASAFQPHRRGICAYNASGKPIACTWLHCGGRRCCQNSGFGGRLHRPNGLSFLCWTGVFIPQLALCMPRAN